MDSEIRYRRLFEAARDGILLLDVQTGAITDVNPFLEQLLDYSHTELVGKTLWDIGLLKDVDACKRAFQQLRANRSIRYEDLPLLTETIPAEALRMAEEHQGPLPLMITDVVMPGFSGAVLAERVAAIRPETRVLYASGYNDNSIELRARGQSYAFLEKPFTREDLLKKVRDLLDLRA